MTREGASGEGDWHVRVKNLCFGGTKARFEVPLGDTYPGIARADVLVDSDGLHAIEVQHSPISLDDVRRRMEVHRAAGLRSTVWVLDADAIGVDAHVRLAGPLRTGSHHMLRRSYSFDNGGGDAGLLFTCFQRDLRTFAITQRQLDQGDRLMGFATPTGSGSFLILPGYTEHTPLGSALVAAQ